MKSTDFFPKSDPAISEARLQQECFMWFHNTYPQYRGLFFRIKNEETHRIRGARNKAMGTIPGVADSCLLPYDGWPAFIEFKTPTGKQSKVQKEWQIVVEKASCGYYIIRTLTEFKDLCQTLLD